MRAATGETCDSAAHAPHARKFLFAVRASVNESHRINSRYERQIMTAPLAADPQIAARSAPLVAMRQNSATPSPKLSENVSEFVSQSAIDFGRMLRQSRI